MMWIAYVRPDGGVSLVTPAPNFMAQFKNKTDALAAVRAKSVPADATDVVEFDGADIPTDRVFRDAWVMVGRKPAIDMPKARTIHMDRIRLERTLALKDADVEVKKAEDSGSAAELAKARTDRQSLRDIPQTIVSVIKTNGTVERVS